MDVAPRLEKALQELLPQEIKVSPGPLSQEIKVSSVPLSQEIKVSPRPLSQEIKVGKPCSPGPLEAPARFEVAELSSFVISEPTASGILLASLIPRFGYFARAIL